MTSSLLTMSSGVSTDRCRFTWTLVKGGGICFFLQPVNSPLDVTQSYPESFNVVNICNLQTTPHVVVKLKQVMQTGNGGCLPLK